MLVCAMSRATGEKKNDFLVWVALLFKIAGEELELSLEMNSLASRRNLAFTG